MRLFIINNLDKLHGSKSLYTDKWNKAKGIIYTGLNIANFISSNVNSTFKYLSINNKGVILPYYFQRFTKESYIKNFSLDLTFSCTKKHIKFTETKPIITIIGTETWYIINIKNLYSSDKSFITLVNELGKALKIEYQNNKFIIFSRKKHTLYIGPNFHNICNFEEKYSIEEFIEEYASNTLLTKLIFS